MTFHIAGTASNIIKHAPRALRPHMATNLLMQPDLPSIAVRHVRNCFMHRDVHHTRAQSPRTAESAAHSAAERIAPSRIMRKCCLA